jgi:hypothetical protein
MLNGNTKKSASAVESPRRKARIESHLGTVNIFTAQYCYIIQSVIVYYKEAL